MRYLLIFVLVILLTLLIFSCGEKITRPEEVSFEGATVLVDQAVLWGLNGGSLVYEQLIVNGDMESWQETDSAVYEVDNWLLSSDSLYCTQETVVVSDGDYSAELYWTSEDDQVFESDPIPVVEDSTYTCSVYVYDNDDAGQAQLVFNWNNGSANTFDNTTNTTDWQLLTASMAVPDGADSLQVGIRLVDILEGLSDTTFLQLNPPWDSANGYGFSGPGKLIVGNDTYIYVCDTGNDRIVRLDAAGTEYESYNVPHPIGITQNEILHLLVVNGTSSVYKIDVGPNGDGQAVISYNAAADPMADTMFTDDFIFTDISDMPTDDKSYFVCGYDSLIDGTGQVYILMGTSDVEENTDVLLDARWPVEGEDPDVPDTASNPIVDYGTGVGYADHPNGITAFLRSDGLYLLTTQDSSSFKTQLLSWYTNSYYHVAYFEADILPGNSPDLYADENLDIRPNAATIDSSGNIYIVCSPNSATGDSACAYKFNIYGELMETWGYLGEGSGMMSNPLGVAYDNFADRRTVYISDTGNNRILRYKLSTDIED